MCRSVLNCTLDFIHGTSYMRLCPSFTFTSTRTLSHPDLASTSTLWYAVTYAICISLFICFLSYFPPSAQPLNGISDITIYSACIANLYQICTLFVRRCSSSWFGIISVLKQAPHSAHFKIQCESTLHQRQYPLTWRNFLPQLNVH